METSKLKKFAQYARRYLIEQVSVKLKFVLAMDSAARRENPKAVDEFAGKNKRVDNALVDIMKNYMAHKSFPRGVETLSAEASMVFIGNTQHALPYMLKHMDLFDELPEKYYDSAFLDRLHFYIPGWEIDINNSEDR